MSDVVTTKEAGIVTDSYGRSWAAERVIQTSRTEFGVTRTIEVRRAVNHSGAIVWRKAAPSTAQTFRSLGEVIEETRIQNSLDQWAEQVRDYIEGLVKASPGHDDAFLVSTVETMDTARHGRSCS